MRVEVIRNKSATEREWWTFHLHIARVVSLRLDSYLAEKMNRYGMWRPVNIWQRGDKRSNGIATPPLPDSVVGEARVQYMAMILDAKVQI